MTNDRVLKEAAFAPNVITYLLTTLSIAFGCTVVGIPLLLIARPVGRWYWTRYYARLRVYTTTRDLKVHRGLLIREEKSIPLEKITDLAVFQGPIMRHYGLKGIRVETAGQSSGMRALVSIIGIEDVDGFRDLVLAQRDRVAEREQTSVPRAAADAAEGLAAPDGRLLGAIDDIRDTLHRIESRLAAEQVSRRPPA